jgi:DNA-binding MarR family transcriptional regulator
VEVAYMPAAVSQELLTGAQHGTIGTLLRQVFTRFAARPAEDGPQFRDFVVLDALAGEDAASQQDLARRIDVNRTTMVKLIDRLQNAGYVTRARNPANRRTYVLSMTVDGRTALEHMRQAASDHDAQITAALTPAERRRLISLLNHLLPEPDQAAIPSVEHLVTQALYRLRRLGDRALAGSGLRTRHFGVLPALDLFGPCPQQDLARVLSLTEPTIAQLVDELVQTGLATRGQDSHDRRRYAVELTDLGRDRIPLLLAAMGEVEAEVRSVLGADGRQELHTLLTKILRNTPDADD